jgi:uncharacterized protein (TIGR02145 family)
MTQNLRSTYTWKGNLKREITEGINVSNDYDAVSYYYPNANENILTSYPQYGLLYTWGAANIGTVTMETVNAFPNKPSDRQGICPEGWVIPSDYDFNQLEKEIATNPGLYSSQTETFTWNVMYENLLLNWRPNSGNTTLEWWGRSMKSPTAVTTTVPNGVSNTDGTGFNALLVGNFHSGSSNGYGGITSFWSSSANNATDAWRRHVDANYSGAARNTISKYYLCNVRCKKQ